MTFHRDPLEHLLRIVEHLVPTGYIGDGTIREMQDAAARIRLHAWRADGASFPQVEGARLPVGGRHARRSEGDEMACSCGLRWGVDEPDPHP